jgi:hypothetical protein
VSLVEELQAIGLTDIVRRAEAGEFHAAGPHDEPRAVLVEALKAYVPTKARGVRALLKRVRAGEFDG